ncbi:MAG: recombination mediator RecR [Planctomycetes bacterium]|jgi:recombination protein RecR|nr:recombination mediator RecR [Planctomycetota bacterium]
MRYPETIQKLIELLSELPSVGPKTAERYVLYLLRQPADKLKILSQTLGELKEKTLTCQRCFMLSDQTTCPICADQKRQITTLCLVASSQDIINLENTKQYNGLYFVLGGLINTIENITPEDINIKLLLKRIQQDKIEEIILALNPNLEGETTTLYLIKILKQYNIKVTRLARGLPSGSNLEYVDEMTLANALKYRNEMS